MRRKHLIPVTCALALALSLPIGAIKPTALHYLLISTSACDARSGKTAWCVKASDKNPYYHRADNFSVIMGLPPTLNIDFTTGSLPSTVTYTGTGDTVCMQTSDTAVNCVAGAGNTPIYETRGAADGAGVGLWVMGGFSNFFGTFDHRYDLWAPVGTPTVTINATTAPDGSGNGGLVQDTSAAQLQYITFTFGGNGNYTDSIWVKDYVTSPPTAPGMLSMISTLATGVSFGTGSTNWRRVVTTSPASVSDSLGIMQLLPAGAQPGSTSASATGGTYLWGETKYNGYIDWPLVLFTTTHAYQGSAVRVAAGSLGNIFSAIGDADVEIEWISATDWQEHGADKTFFRFPTPDGDFSLSLTASTALLAFKVRGATVLTIPNIGVGPRGKYVRARAWYKPSTGKAGVRVCYQGACYIDLTAVASGSPLATPTDGFLGSNDAATPPTQPINGRLVRFRNYTWASAPAPIPAELIAVGDSIVADDISYPLSSQWFYSANDAHTRWGIGSVAHPGDVTGDQKTAYLNSTWYGSPAVKVILNQVGVNNIIVAGENAATIETKMQDLVNTEAAGNPGAAIYWAIMTPVRAGMTGGQYTVWTTVNAWLRGGGLTGIAGLVTHNSDDINDGSDNLSTALTLPDGNIVNCDPGDHVHPITPCRAIMAGAWNTAIRAGGFLQ